MNKVECNLCRFYIGSEIPMIREARSKKPTASSLFVIARRSVVDKKIRNGIALAFFLLIFSSCNFNSVVDTNQTVEDNQWLYANAAKADFEITDATKAYNVNFKLRINTEYRYSNLFVLATFKDVKTRKRIRYQFKLAKADGQWLGKGSGDLYTYAFPLLRNHRFPDTGKYHVEIEQNMRDNPLLGVSDIGIEVN